MPARVCRLQCRGGRVGVPRGVLLSACRGIESAVGVVRLAMAQIPNGQNLCLYRAMRSCRLVASEDGTVRMKPPRSRLACLGLGAQATCTARRPAPRAQHAAKAWPPRASGALLRIGAAQRGMQLRAMRAAKRMETT
eukprot:5695771-Prymnesium_polylepis.1